MDHFEIGEIEVLNDISISPFNFANMSSKNIANPAASNATLTSFENTVQIKLNVNKGICDIPNKIHLNNNRSM